MTEMAGYDWKRLGLSGQDWKRLGVTEQDWICLKMTDNGWVRLKMSDNEWVWLGDWKRLNKNKNDSLTENGRKCLQITANVNVTTKQPKITNRVA